MTPLLFAAALAASGASPIPSDQPLPPQLAERLRARQACARLGIPAVAPDGARLWKLGELPPGVLEHAIWRKVDGCPVREIVYRGQTYYLASSPPRMESGPAIGRRLSRPDHRQSPDGAPDRQGSPP